MPVQSKSGSGREKKPPPTPRTKPKPILKTPRTAWTQNDVPSDGSRTYPNEVPASPTNSYRYTLQSRPYLNGPQPFSSPSVQFLDEEGDKNKAMELRDMPKSGYFLDGQPVQNGSMGEESVGETDLSTISEASGGPLPQPSPKYSRAGGSRASYCGLEALQECEEHTDWANAILQDNKLPLISDLRKSVGDGYTLPTILEIISGVSLHFIKPAANTKEEKGHNLGKCLEFLHKRGADVSQIDLKELEDGNLKICLLLIGVIRKHFENSYKPSQNGHTDHIDSTSSEEPIVTKPPPLPPRVMPGATKLTGAVPTPFLAGRETLQRTRHNLSTSPTRKNLNQSEEILPGVLGREPVINDQTNKQPHTALISTTELGTNGVAQHGVEERRQHLASSSPGPNNRGILLRHPNAKAGAPVIQEMNMPQGVTRAWTASPRPQAQNGTGNSNGGTVEDRLRQLITTNQNKAAGAQGRDTQENYNGGGLFHGGGSEVFDDGDILIVPPPQSRNSPDFDIMMVGNHSYGPGYRHPGQSPRGQRSRGYVPSQPTERQQGPRADALFTPPNRGSQKSPYQRQASAPHQTETMPGMTQGHDNYAFSQDDPGLRRNRPGTTPNRPTVLAKPAGKQRGGGNDLRNAWNKLYGRPPQPGQSSPSSPHISRGDNLRSSFGPESQSRSQQSPFSYRNKSPSQTHTYNRPVSAPAPAQMQVHFQGQGQFPGHGDRTSQDNLDHQGHSSLNTSAHRESPMGQSSSTQGQLEESTSSQQSGNSQGPGHLNGPGHARQQSVDGYHKNINSPGLSPSSPQSNSSQTFAIGPAAKYPENTSRPSSARKIPEPGDVGKPPYRDIGNEQRSWDELDRGPLFKEHDTSRLGERDQKGGKTTNFASDLTTALQAASRGNKHINTRSDGNHNKSYDRLHERSHDQSREFQFQDHSIFDYEASHSETSGSVTPPLPPLSPTNTPPESPLSDRVPPLPRSLSATNVSSPERPFEIDHLKMMVDKKKPRRTSELQFRMDRKPHGKKSSNKPMGFKSKGANLREVRESDTDSDLSFDIENTILTVESHDTEQPHPAGDILTSQEASALRQQLHEMEFKYNDLKSKVSTKPGHPHAGHHGYQQGPGPPPIGRQRRWSIGSSDTSSFRRESKFKPGKQIQHKHHSREFKNISKRFQRLESHVVTLARSVAHLSSELRTHNTMVHDLESVKKELREVRDNPGRAFPSMLGGSLMANERYRDYVPGLLNPKRVNKLTKFFGEEPPLLQIFLKELGYERYLQNFETEHIGMIELPYMTEDRLEKIGIPMGPRLRILQEAQICYKHENFNVYMV